MFRRSSVPSFRVVGDAEFALAGALGFFGGFPSSDRFRALAAAEDDELVSDHAVSEVDRQSVDVELSRHWSAPFVGYIAMARRTRRSMSSSSIEILLTPKRAISSVSIGNPGAKRGQMFVISAIRFSREEEATSASRETASGAVSSGSSRAIS